MADTEAARTDAETKEDFGPPSDPATTVSRWLAEIAAYEKTFETWSTRVPKIVKRYRDELKASSRLSSEADEQQRTFNVLWANVSTLQPALYSRSPVPEVGRRWKDRDPIARAAAEILERGLSYSLDAYDFDATAKGARDDYLLAGRGQAWVRYIPTYGEEASDQIFLTQAEPNDEASPFLDPDDQEIAADLVQIDDEGRAFTQSDPYKPVVYEEVRCEHVLWSEFGHIPAISWERVPAVWKREKLTRQQLVERFGDVGRDVPLNAKRENVAEESVEAHASVFKQAPVYEIWDKETRKVYWICPDYKTAPLDELDDPLGLEGFFPCPKPLYATTTTDSLVPVPDYIEYQSQADELDDLTERIDLLTEALRVAGVYDGDHEQIESLLDGNAENVLVGISNWAAFAEKGGLKGAVSFLPIEEIATVLQGLIQAREQVKQDLYEITGLSDIIRGQVDPREKLGQSRLKGQFASLRLRERQGEMERFTRDVLRIKAEIIAEHFSPETLLSITGWDLSADAQMAQQAGVQEQEALPAGPRQFDMQKFEAAVALLKDDKLRGFRIDIETDSTVLEDRQAEQESRIEFLSAVTPFLQQAVPAAQQYPELRDMFAEMLLFGVRGFRAGRHLETVFEEAIDAMRGAQPNQQNEPDPLEQMRLQIEGQKLQIEEQRLQADSAMPRQTVR